MISNSDSFRVYLDKGLRDYFEDCIDHPENLPDCDREIKIVWSCSKGLWEWNAIPSRVKTGAIFERYVPNKYDYSRPLSNAKWSFNSQTKLFYGMAEFIRTRLSDLMNSDRNSCTIRFTKLGVENIKYYEQKYLTEGSPEDEPWKTLGGNFYFVGYCYWNNPYLSETLFNNLFRPFISFLFHNLGFSVVTRGDEGVHFLQISWPKNWVPYPFPKPMTFSYQKTNDYLTRSYKLQDNHCDLTIVASGGTIKVHRLIMAFLAPRLDPWVNKKIEIVTAITDFIYTAQDTFEFDIENEINPLEVMELAHSWGFDGIAECAANRFGLLNATEFPQWRELEQLARRYHSIQLDWIYKCFKVRFGSIQVTSA